MVVSESLLKNIFLTTSSAKYKIHFLFNKKESTAIFTVKKSGNNLQIQNKCINITYNGKSYSSLLKKNDEIKHCFDPPLNIRKMGNINTEKYTMTDALQVLATKLKVALSDVPIDIGDTATIDDVSITPFRILRGGDGLYEKYGYESEGLNQIKERLKTMRWSEFMDIPDVNKLINYFIGKFERLKDRLESAEDSMLVVDVLKNVTFEDEKATLNNNYDASFSNNLYKILEEWMNIEDGGSLVLYLNRDGYNWKNMKKAVIIREIEEMATGGKRKTRRKISRKN